MTRNTFMLLTPGFAVFLYLALVSVMTGGGGPVTLMLPAPAVVMAVRWWTPGLAAAWMCGFGLLYDAIGTGPIGLRAAVYVLLTAVLPRCGFDPAQATPGRWVRAVMLTAVCDGLITSVLAAPSPGDWLPTGPDLLPFAVSSLVTALSAGLIVLGWNRVTGTPCRMH